MNVEKKEYTLGQVIRFEAISLYHHAFKLQELDVEPHLLGAAAAKLRESVRTGPNGEFRGINRQEQHYRVLIELMGKTREQLEKMPASNESNEACLLVNQCRHSCDTVLDVMLNQARLTGAGS